MTKGARSVGRGFTLIELLIVIVIIAILTSLTISALGTSRSKARDSTRVSDIKRLQLVLELYYNSGNNAYPTTLSSLSPTYTTDIPRDPKTNASYVYVQTTSGTGYHLGSTLELYNTDILQNDADATDTTPVFKGFSTDCGNTTATLNTDERCYDVISQ